MWSVTVARSADSTWAVGSTIHWEVGVQPRSSTTSSAHQGIVPIVILPRLPRLLQRRAEAKCLAHWRLQPITLGLLIAAFKDDSELSKYVIPAAHAEISKYMQ